MAAACYLYVLPLPGEDIAKLGISRDPLRRIQSFASRYYERFDLPASALVEFDSRREAQRRETQLHRALREWNAVQPVTVPLRAGGHTEWYRGALAPLQAELERDRASGLVVHQPATGWWRERLRGEQALLFEWASQWLETLPDLSPHTPGWREVVDVLDAWPALGLEVGAGLPDTLRLRYARYRRAWWTSSLDEE